jgi:GntR family transcriptional regulator
MYLQVRDGLRKLCETGTVSPGTALPPERVLCEHLGISRMTLRQAYDLLEREGLIECQRGRGTFVSLRRIQKQQQEMRSFSEEMQARGARPSTRLISFTLMKPSSTANAFFGLPKNELVFEIQRLWLSDGTPLALETVQIPHALCPELKQYDLAKQSLYQVLEEDFGLELTHCVEEISAVPPTRKQKQLLGLPRSGAVLMVRRKTYTRQETPVELAVATYRGDLYTAIVYSSRKPKQR